MKWIVKGEESNELNFLRGRGDEQFIFGGNERP